jgi:hypothetical protein
MTKHEIESSGKTVTTVHHEASTFLNFSTQENPVKVSIFDKEYLLSWVAIDTVWEEGAYIPESYMKVAYVSILKSGKAGEAYDRREFGIKDIGKWIVGEEDLFKKIFKQHEETIQNIIKEKALAYSLEGATNE